MPNLLDVAMIVKNEVEDLPACLESLQALTPILGRIHVYDTGSTDGSQEIARSYGAQVLEGYWDDDFARARNEALAVCDSTWVLVIDADETLTVDVAALQERLEQMPVGVDLLNITHRQHVAGQEVSTLSARLLERRRMRYAGAVQEAPRPRAGGEPVVGELSPSVVSLRQARYATASPEQRLRRNLEMADSAIARTRSSEDTEGLSRALIDRARTRIAMGEVEAGLADYREASELDFSGEYHTWGMERYAECLISLGRVDQTERIIALLEVRSGAPDVVKLLRARVALAQRDHIQAVELARSLDQESDTPPISHEQTQVVELRMAAAEGAQLHDEALACCLRLMVHHRTVACLGPRLMRLWGERPVQDLVEILGQAPTDLRPFIVEELALQGGVGLVAAQALHDAPAMSAM